MERYKRKTEIVEAVLLTLENIADVKKWCGGKIYCRPGMREITGIELAINFHCPIGNYIFKDADGSFHYWSTELFEKTYELDKQLNPIDHGQP